MSQKKEAGLQTPPTGDTKKEAGLKTPPTADTVFEECPHCGSVNVQNLAEDSWFCLDCDWDTLTVIPAAANNGLLASLRYGDIHSRRIAAQSLINIGDEERDLGTLTDIEALLDALDDEDADVRYFVAVALGKIEANGAARQAEGLDKLRYLAQSDASALVREGAKDAVERIESQHK